jgi:histidine phosphotransferase ChpT
MRDVELVGLICSRLCHDLISPVGAVYNGIEVLTDDDDPNMRESAIELMTDSAMLAIDRLKYYRLAFGGSGGPGIGIGMSEAREALKGFLAGGRVEIVWSDQYATPDLELPKSSVKLLLNLAAVAAEALLRGGTLTVEIDVSEHRHELRLIGEGERVSLDDANIQVLGGEHVEFEISPKLAPAALAGQIVRESGGKIAAETSENRVSIVFSS